MNSENIKLNKFYLIIALAIAGWFTYATLNGIAYWESGDVARNTEYHSTGGGHHGGGYGAHFYHK